MRPVINAILLYIVALLICVIGSDSAKVSGPYNSTLYL